MSEKSMKSETLDDLHAEVERLTAELQAAKAAIEAGTDTHSARETAEEIGERMQEGLNDLHKRIDANPVPSALIAFAIGFLIGRIVTR